MIRQIYLSLALICLAALSTPTFAQQNSETSATKGKKAVSDTVFVRMKTSISEDPIEIELYSKKAPISVENFVKYVEDGFYNGTIFHRVISDFMVQGGGFTKDMKKKDTRAPIKNEAKNGLKNDRGTIAMARTSVVDSATAQFYINTKDNPALNHRSDRDFGYAVFGKVTKGMDVVDKIEAVKTHTLETDMGAMADVPVTPVVIESVTIVK